MGHWAFSWVQIIAHNKKSLVLILSLASLLMLSGLGSIQLADKSVDISLLLIGLVAMAGIVAWFLDSPKIGLLQLSLSGFVACSSLGVVGWLNLNIDGNSILGLMVILTIVSSNLVHILTTLSREMARGLYQFDAIAEAIKLNSSPIFLSNFTTAVGFMLAAMVQPELTELAYLVVIGVFLSFLTTLTWLPLIVLSWLLEFRVGNSSDRKGLTMVALFLQRKPTVRKLILLFSAAVLTSLIVLHWPQLKAFNEFFIMLSVFAVIFWLAWHSLKLALLNVLSSVFALVLSLSLLNTWFEPSAWSALLWLVPLGIIIDDGIHFFARLARAKQTVFSDNQSAVIFAMASIGRPIWITSWVLLVGLVILLFSQNSMIHEAALLTITALIVTAFLVLLFIPSLLMSTKQADS